MTGTKEAVLKMYEMPFQQHWISEVNCRSKPLTFATLFNKKCYLSGSNV